MSPLFMRFLNVVMQELLDWFHLWGGCLLIFMLLIDRNSSCRFRFCWNIYIYLSFGLFGGIKIIYPMPNLLKTPPSTMIFTASYLAEFHGTVHSQSARNHLSAVQCWQPPSDPYKKINVDDTVFKSSRSGGGGVFFF